MSAGTMIHVLCIYRRMIPSVRLCGHAQLSELAEEGKIEYRALQENRVWTEDLNWADVIVLGKLDSWAEIQIVRMCTGTGRKLLYILDDDLLNIPQEIQSAANYAQPSVQRHIREMIYCSDGILSPSPILLERYAKEGKEEIQLEEPAICPTEYVPHTGDEPVKIGFAGSPDRSGDIEALLKPVLMKTRDKYQDRVEFCFYGAKPSFAEELGARFYPYTSSYDEYREQLGRLQWDIGLAPLPDTPFHNGKHYNKYTEYSAEGIAGIYSDVMPYQRLRALCPDVILVPNEPEAWKEKLWQLIDNSELRETQRKQAREIAGTKLTVSECAKPLLGYLDTLEIQKTKCRANDVLLLLIKAGNIFARSLTKLKGILSRGR